MQKYAKVKYYYLLIFEQKELNFFLKDQKLPTFYNKYFFNEKMWKFWHLMAKKLKGWSHKLETLHVKSLGAILKKLRKQKNCGGSPSLCNLHFRYTNIFQIYHNLIQWRWEYGLHKSQTLQCRPTEYWWHGVVLNMIEKPFWEALTIVRYWGDQLSQF